ncbi:MAG: hypothetical protein AABN33_05855 [Acidobacteriota bacterium]
MAAARFCSECGERLRVKRLGSLPFPSFCSHCSPRFNLARLMLIVALTLSAAVGFAIGHYTTAREPFYYIGTPVESSSNRIAPPPNDNAAHSSRSSEAVKQREHMVASPSASEGICGARTKSGRPCQRKVKGGGYCWQHREKFGAEKLAGTSR